MSRVHPIRWLALSLVIVAAFLVLAGTDDAEAHHNGCPTVPTGDDLANWPAGCRNFIVDPGPGALMDRAGLLARESLYTSPQVGFSQNFLWYSEEKVITITDPNVKWTGCDVVTGYGAACSLSQIRSDFGPIPHPPGTGGVPGGVLRTYHDAPSVSLSVFEWGGVWIAKVCGNYTDVAQRPNPIPKIKTTKFHDLDRDGQRDAGEGPLAGFVFRVVRESSAVGQTDPQVVGTVTSTASGDAVFSLNGHGPGRYYFEEIVPSGWDRTTPARQYVDVGFGIGNRTLVAGPFGNVENTVDVEKSDFFLVDPPASLDARTPTDLTVRAELTNNGPAGPIEVEDILTVTGPSDCVIDPGSQRKRLVLGRAGTPSATDFVDFDVTVTCDQPSDHPFDFENEVVIVTPGVTDTNPANNFASFRHIFEVFAEADLAVQDVTLDCDAQTTVGADFTCVLSGDIANLGPYGPVDATESFELDVPPDCTVDGGGPLPLGGLSVDVGAPVAVSSEFTVNCSYRSFHEITGTVSVEADNIHVIDDPANNSATATAVTEVFHDADLQATNLALFCDEVLGEPDFTCTAIATVVNNGPAPDVEAVTTVTITVPGDCTASPSLSQSDTRVLVVGSPVDIAFTWDLSCSDGVMLHPFAFTADVAPSPDEPHAVDEPGPIVDDWTVPFCMETVNPNGNNTPQAPGNGGQGQNQDGFYEFGAKTLTGPEQVWIEDTGTGTVFGPFPSGTRVKYIEANGAEPTITPMGGNNGNGNGNAQAVDYQIRGQGDAAAVYFDEDGNVIRAACLVPPFPQ